MIIAVVMVLQRLLGLSDREAVERFTFDLRWKYAAGGVGLEYPSFVHTVLVDMRARLQASSAPDRIFRVVLDVAKAAGLVGRKRVLDSTPIYDAVATQDTVTMVRAAIRGLLGVLTPSLADAVRAGLERDDDYASPGKPTCAWDDQMAREALVDALARDAHAALRVVEGRSLSQSECEAATLLATVVGQDIDEGEDGIFRIARRVAPDRTISTVDSETRHGHKTASRSFDGYKAHIAIDPDSEIITNTVVTAGNAGDASAAYDLLRADSPDLGESTQLVAERNVGADDDSTAASPNESTMSASCDPSRNGSPTRVPSDPAEPPPCDGSDDSTSNEAKLTVYGDAAYGTAELLEQLENAGIHSRLKVAAPTAGKGRFTKDDFDIDLEQATVECPNEVLVPIRPRKNGGGTAKFGAACEECPLKSSCTDSKAGRLVTIHAKEQLLETHRRRQKDPNWQQDYKSTRPKVERKIGHLTRRRHGGRRARLRGRLRVALDFTVHAASVNLARLAKLLAPGKELEGSPALA